MPTTPDLNSFEDVPGSERIQRSFLFRDLNYDEANRLKRLCELRRCSAGELLIEEDSLGQALYLILEGHVCVRQEAQDRTIARLGPGQLFGEMSLVDDLLTSATVRTETPCTLLVVPRGPFQGLLDTDARLASKVYRTLCRILSQRLRQAQQDASGAEPLPDAARSAPRSAR
jgi:CRP-like cAMP-binding protein